VGIPAHEQLFAIDIQSFASLIVGRNAHAMVMNLSENLIKGFHSSSVTVNKILFNQIKEKNG